MDELYQSQILDLARLVRQSAEIAHPTHHGHVKNTVCGDEISITLYLKDEHITALHISVEGCALCEAGAGLLYNHAKGATLSEMAQLSNSLKDVLASDDDTMPEHTALAPFTALREVKNRHKCVTLAFAALGSIKSIS